MSTRTKVGTIAKQKKNVEPKAGTCQTVYTVSALTLLTAYEKLEYARVLGRADIILADGVGAVWAMQRFSKKKPEHITGIDLVYYLANICAMEKLRVFFLGARPGVAQRAANSLAQQYPGLEIAGTHDGFWQAQQTKAIIKIINQSQANLLLVGLGQPQQEFFLDKNKSQLQVSVAIGVGGSFDVISGDLQRAPRWMQHLGLEWLYRFLQEPTRLKRMLRLPYFVWVFWRMPLKFKDKRDKL